METATSKRQGCVLGVDFGTRRIGVARSDHARLVAAPMCVLERGASHAVDHARLAELVADYGANLVVVGLPVALSGDLELAAQAVLAEVAELAEVLPVPVELADERLSTAEVLARRREALRERDAARRGGRGGRGGGDRSRRSSTRRPVVDDLAAAVVLQGWLDAHVGAR